MTATQVLAVDLGAASGRVSVVNCSATDIRVGESIRFGNGPVAADGLRWDLPGLFGRVTTAVGRLLTTGAAPRSIGVDTWGVDYGWLRADGTLVDDPYCYRDRRTAGLDRLIDQDQAYRITGIPGHTINTATQLLADRRAGRGFGTGERLLFLPDLLILWLTGVAISEPTIASTSQLLGAESGDWSTDLLAGIGLEHHQLPELRSSGPIGPLRPEVAGDHARHIWAHTVASHDTASAIVATPLDDDAGYISLGTWACVGLELGAPMITEAARQAGFANERGLDDTFTFHRSAMGLWLVQQCLLAWPELDAEKLLAAAASVPTGALINPDDDRLFAPGDMPDRIRELCRQADQPEPRSPAEIARCIVDSLAASLAGRLHQAAELTGRTVRRVHVVGGGARSPVLCQAIADAAGLPVIAGPAEATTLGNALAQARAFDGPATLTEMRALVARSFALVEYQPDAAPPASVRRNS